MATEGAIRMAAQLRRRGASTDSIAKRLQRAGQSREDAFFAAKAAKILVRPYRPNVRWIRDHT